MSNIKSKLPIIILAVVTGIIGILLFTNTETVKADSDPDLPLDCLECHQQTLSYHDGLGKGNEACWACHSDSDMSKLELANKTTLRLFDSSTLCGQCHEERYDDWQTGTHGFPGTEGGGRCVTCHDPHEPQISLQGITLPHPDPAPPYPDPPTDLVMILVLTIVFLAGLAIIIAKREQAE